MSHHLMHMLRRSDGLLDRAAVALQRTVAADPDNAAALHRLGDVHRGLGALPEALECYRRVVALRPADPNAQRLVAILSGKAPPDAPSGTQPSAFVRMADFLPAERCKALLGLALANRERFKPAPYAGLMQRTHAEVDSSHGKLLVDPSITDPEIRPWFEARLRSAFAQALPRLPMREPSNYQLEIALSAYCGGGKFFAKHSDGGKGKGGERIRTLCFCYYFHRQPRAFAGGDLLLYDGDGTRGFTRIEPRHNSIVFFPAACIHQVAPFERDVADFGDARFAVHGWLNVSVAQ